MENRIRELRKKNRMSQIRLSIELEVSQETISAYENGKYYPCFQSLLKMSEIFSASIDYIMGVTDENAMTKALKPEEEELLNLFRRLDSIEKSLVIAYLNGLYDSSKKRNIHF